MKQEDKWIEEMANTFTAPLIVYPGGWEDTIPDNIKNKITIERLLRMMKKDGKHEATDSEVAAYIYTASCCFPLNYHSANIYFYVLKSVFSNLKGMPDFVEEAKISEYEEGMLKKLRCWIYKKQTDELKARRRADRAGAKKKQTPTVSKIVGGPRIIETEKDENKTFHIKNKQEELMRWF